MKERSLKASACALMLTFSGGSIASASPLLGDTAESFAVLAGAGITSSGATTINGNMGASPTNSISGFPPGTMTGGMATDPTVTQLAHNDALAASNFLAIQTPTRILTGSDLGGLILTPGVYEFASSAQLTGTLTLDAQGRSDAVFIFDIGSTLTTADNSIVSVINGSPDDGLFWNIGSSATLGDSSLFVGNILAGVSITLDPFARISCGRALAGLVAVSGAVTLANANSVSVNAGSDCVGGYGGGYQSMADGGFELIAAGDSSPAAVPEPTTLALLGSGLAGLAMIGRRHRVIHGATRQNSARTGV